MRGCARCADLQMTGRRQSLEVETCESPTVRPDTCQRHYQTVKSPAPSLDPLALRAWFYRDLHRLMQGGFAAVLVGFNDIFQVDVLHVRVGMIPRLAQPGT